MSHLTSQVGYLSPHSEILGFGTWRVRIEAGFWKTLDAKENFLLGFRSDIDVCDV
jgi:hypothetical protein